MGFEVVTHSTENDSCHTNQNLMNKKTKRTLKPFKSLGVFSAVKLWGLVHCMPV